MKEEILKQYNGDGLVDKYERDRESMNSTSNQEFRDFLADIDMQEKEVLDIGCGTGDLCSFVINNGGVYTGLDISEEMIKTAHFLNPNSNFIVGDCMNMETIKDSSCHVLISKWALQSVDSIDKVYREIVRVGKTGADVLILVTHPLRHFLEKRVKGKNYFKQELVSSNLFNNTIAVQEPSHTLMDFLSNYFLEYFELEKIYESYDFPGAEQINGDTYPTHLILKAKLKSKKSSILHIVQ